MSFINTNSINSCIELNNGDEFIWKPFEKVSSLEMDRRIAQLSQNPPKIIKNNDSIEEKIGEMAWISPLWSEITITPEIEAKNRATILFFEVVGRYCDCEPMRLFLNKKGWNRYPLNPTEADLLAREMKFFIRRIAEDNKSSYKENLDNVVTLDFDGYHLGFLPDEIEVFKNLRELKVANCDLTQIPHSIGKLKKLEYLNLNGNQLENLPNTITDFPELHFIDLLGNKLSYSTLFDIAKNFYLKGHAWGALKVAAHAIDALQKSDSNESCFVSPYIDITELLKNITEEVCFKNDYKYLTALIFDVVNKIPDDYEKLEVFLEILEGIEKAKKNIIKKKKYSLQMDQFGESFKLQDEIINKSIEIANSFPRDLGRHSALCSIARVFFSIGYYHNGFDIAEQAIKLAHSRPTYNYLTMVNDVKDAELKQISNILDELPEKLAKEGKFELAVKAIHLLFQLKGNDLALVKLLALVKPVEKRFE